MSLQRIHNPGKIHSLARLVPAKLLEWLIARTIHRSVVHDAGQDFVIWENKRHIQPPALAQGDGPIGAFRVWARQFYPQPAATAHEGDSAAPPEQITSQA